MLSHSTDPKLTNIYRILQSGYLKPGIRTGVSRMYGSELSKYIYTMIMDNKYLIPRYSTFRLDKYLLLDNISYMHASWGGEPGEDSFRVDSKTSKKELNKFLKQIKKEGDKYRDPLKHEILSTQDIDLKKYLRVLKLNKKEIPKAKKTYQKIMKMMEKKYPDVKVILK
jgi:hypothetical protein